MLIVCKNCGEYMDGDGYQVVLHCPRADEDQVACAEPDANPIECQEAFEVIRETFNKTAPAPKVKKRHALVLTEGEWERLKSLIPLLEEQARGNETFARAHLSGKTGTARVVTDWDREQAAQHRKAAREYRRLIKSIKEQDPHD